MMIDEKLTKIFAHFHKEVRDLLASHSRDVGAYLARQFVVHASRPPSTIAAKAKRAKRTCAKCGSETHDIRFHKKRGRKKVKTAVLEIAKAA